MKQESPRRPRAALLVSAAALLATPAIAQDATQAAPPPIQAAPQTTPQTAPVTPAPAPAPAAMPSPDPQPQAAAPAAASRGSSPSSASDVPVDPQAAAEAAAEDAQLNAARRAGHRPTRARTYHPARRAAPVAAPPPSPAAPAAPTPAPSAVPTPAPSATPTPTAHPPAREATPVPAAPEPAGTPGLATTRETTSTRAPVWRWVLLGLVVLAALAGALAWRRRRSDVEADWDATPPITPVSASPHVEPVAVTPTPVERVAEPADAPRYLHRLTPLAAAPVAAAASATAAAAPVAMPAVEPADIAPVAAEDVSVAAASADDIASLTAAAAPVADRPWLEFAMRPVRAGTTVDEALVEIELTVVNSGMVAAENVQIGTYLLAAGADAEIDRLLAAPLGEGAPAPVTIAAGEGTRVDATLALSRAELLGGAGQGSFQPVVVADARYPLPAGGEGRTSAAFLVGGIADDGDVLEPIVLSHTLLRDDVEARLYRKPQRR